MTHVSCVHIHDPGLGCSEVGSLSQTMYNENEGEMILRGGQRRDAWQAETTDVCGQLRWGWPEEAFASETKACGGER